MTFIEAIKRYRLHLAAMLLMFVALYWKVVPSMVQQWQKDENYSHGFLVPLIAGYFLWQRWPDLKEKLTRPCGLGLAVIVMGLLQLLVSWLGSEYFLMRSSLIVLLAGSVLLLFGPQILKAMALPLGYLFFMVPIPYIIYDMAAFPLKLFVTKLSVWVLKVSGVVVMREGNIIMFPATTLEVADACSGIRSLISLLALAVAYSFFINISARLRWILIISALPIAISTNALRVIATGFLAQWWGAAAAEGFFHEFAGLAVFALAMVMLITFGALLKKFNHQSANETPETETKAFPGGSVSSATAPFARFATVYLLMTATALYLHLHSDVAVPSARPLADIPKTNLGWKMTSQSEMSSGVLEVLKAADYIMRQYTDSSGRKVSLYLGYHSGGKDSGGIHSPKNCLPGSGWYEVSSVRGVLDLGPERLNIVRAVYQKGESKDLFLYWYHVKGGSLSEEYSLKLAEIKNSFLYRRRDSAFVRISVPFETDEKRAAETADAFVRDFYPVLKQFLPS